VNYLLDMSADPQQPLRTVPAPLASWSQEHSLSLVPASEARPGRGGGEDVYVLRDLPDQGYHLISFPCRERLEADQADLLLEVKETPDCTTNLAIYDYGNACIAVIHVGSGALVGGWAAGCGGVVFEPIDDGWLRLRIRLPRTKQFKAYIGCADGLRAQYLGWDRPQFLLRDSVSFVLRGTRDLRLQYPELLDLDRFTIVDVGAAGGLQPHWERLLASNAGHQFDVYLIEPGQGQAAHLRIDYHHHANVRVLELALGGTESRAPIYHTRFPDCTSARRPNREVLDQYAVRPCFEVVGEEIVSFVPYKALVERGVAGAPDFLKLDVQGLEYEVLEGCGDLLSGCTGIELEAHYYPLYEGERLFGEIIELLDGFGFRLRQATPQNSFDGDLVEVNAVFTRSPHRIASEEGRLKLALVDRVLQLDRHGHGSILADQFRAP
jgi:FkbM family methyltransferase